MSYLSTLTENATIYPRTGTDDYSKPTYGAGVATKCRVVLKGSTKYGSLAGRGDASELVTINAVARLPIGTSFNVGDKLVHDSNTYKIVGKRQTPNHSGQIFALNAELSLWPSL